MFCNVHDFWVPHKSVTLSMFYKSPFCQSAFIRFLSSSIEVFNAPRFTSLRLAQLTFESPRFTFPHFGIIHVLDIKFMCCNVHDFWVLHTSVTLSMFYKSPFCQSALYDSFLHQSRSSTLHVLRVYVWHSWLSSHHVLRFHTSA